MAVSICRRVGIPSETVLTGAALDVLSDRELRVAVEKHHVFAELTPGQKVRLVSALKQNGHTVGFLGDGINDIPALCEANVGISVDVAVDAALLPFLPMMSVHLIFLNLIYDLSCTAIPWDNVDEEFIAVPRKWDASSVGSFMLWIGPTSSIVDFTTYIFMYFVFCPLFVSGGVLFNDLAAHTAVQNWICCRRSISDCFIKRDGSWSLCGARHWSFT